MENIIFIVFYVVIITALESVYHFYKDAINENKRELDYKPLIIEITIKAIVFSLPIFLIYL